VALAKQIKFPKGEAQAYNDLGIIQLDLQNMTLAKQLFRQSMAIRTQLKDDKGLAGLHLKMGIVYNKEAHYDSALDAGLKALALYEKLKDDYGIATALNNVGSANNHVGNVESALDYHRRALAIREKINDVPGMGASYVNVGNAYVLLSQFDTAIPYLIKAEEYTRATNSWEYLASALNNLGICYLYKKEYATAKPYAEEAYDIRKQLGDIRSQAISANVCGRILHGLGQHTQAEALLTEALQAADTLESSLTEKMRLYEALAMAYEGQGKWKQALASERTRIQLMDSLKVTDMNARFSEMETQYQTLRKEQQITEQQYELSRKNWMIAIAAAVLVLGSLLAYSYYRRFKLKKRTAIAG
jgi:hypothetical protein